MIETFLEEAIQMQNETKTLEPKPSLVSGYSEESLKDVQVVLININNQSFNLSEKTYNLLMHGKKMKDWVLNSVKEYDVVSLELDFSEDFLPKVKQLSLPKKYTLVLFSDAPLIKNSTIKQVIEYFIIKDLSVLKLTRGYMFKTDYLKTIEKLYSPQMQYFDEEDFMICFNLKQFSLIDDIFASRILSYHQKNGVIILDPASTTIDADVCIESNVLIKSNNKILGSSIIKSGAVISFNNVIDSSAIFAGSFVENSTIKNSIIGENCNVKNYSLVIEKSVLGNGVTLSGYNVVKSKSIKENAVLNFFDKIE